MVRPSTHRSLHFFGATMFDDYAFASWPLILGGATLFASLFTLLALMTELLFEGTLRVTPTVVGFGVTAFIGYVGTAAILRRSPRRDD